MIPKNCNNHPFVISLSFFFRRLSFVNLSINCSCFSGNMRRKASSRDISAPDANPGPIFVPKISFVYHSRKAGVCTLWFNTEDG